VAVTGSPAHWLAAVAMVLARCGRDDDVVLGVVTRPELPDGCAAVPGPFARMLPVRVPVGERRGLAAVAAAAAHALAGARRTGDVPWPALRALLAEDPRVSVAVHDRPGSLAAHAGAAIGIDIAPGAAGGTEMAAVFDPVVVAAGSASALLHRCALALEHGHA